MQIIPIFGILFDTSNLRINNLKYNKMKKVASMLAVVAFLFSMNINAQETEPKQKKKKAKTEKACSTEEKKSCSSAEKKGGCCSSKKAEEKKS